MLDEYKKAKLIINDIIKGVPENIKNDDLKVFTYIYVKIGSMLEYDYRASRLIESRLSGYARERAEDCEIIPASGITSLARGKALCRGFAEVLKVILNKLGIETIIVSSGGHAWNQVLINGEWYNCDLTNDYDRIESGLECKYFLKSNEMIKRKPITEYKECTSSISVKDQKRLIYYAKKEVEKNNHIKALEEIKTKINDKIDCNDLFVVCKIMENPTLVEPFVQNDTFGDEFHKIIINPKRSLVIKTKCGKKNTYIDISNNEEVYPVDYTRSFHCQSSPMGTVYCTCINKGNSSLNDEIAEQRHKELNQKGYLMTFKEYIKKKLGINIDEVTLRKANVLLTLANITKSRPFALSEDPIKAKEQLDKKVYMIKKEN